MLPLVLILVIGFVQGQPWAHFSKQQSLGGVHEAVEIGSGRMTSGQGFRYIMRLTRTGRGRQPTVQWATSATCPAMPAILASMSKITVPHPAPYGVPGEQQQIVLDGTFYDLSAPSTDIMGHLTISSNDGSPLSAWVNTALKQLDGCWSASPPE